MDQGTRPKRMLSPVKAITRERDALRERLTQTTSRLDVAEWRVIYLERALCRNRGRLFHLRWLILGDPKEHW